MACACGLDASTAVRLIFLDHPVYDYFYLALARREAGSVVSTDQRLL
ncbi:MAG: hypothetical protein ACK59A_09580 [Cyanobacteriota bacterium]|jgi:hypothetical protein